MIIGQSKKEGQRDQYGVQCNTAIPCTYAELGWGLPPHLTEA